MSFRHKKDTAEDRTRGGGAFETHSTVWMVHGVVAPVLLDRHTGGENNNRHRRK